MYVRRSNEERSETTRSQLVRAARRLFAEQGYAATQITQVAREAQVSTGALYHHWATKQDLLAAVVSALHLELATRIADSTDPEASPLERFEHAGRIFLRRCADRDVGRIMLVDGPAVLGQVWDRLDRRWWLGPTEALLTQAADAGEIVSEDPELLAVALLGVLSALGRRIAEQPDAVDDASISRVLRSTIPVRRA